MSKIEIDLQEKEKLRREIERLGYSNSIGDSNENLEILAEVLFKLIEENAKEPFTTQQDNEAKLILQMIATKLLCLKDMLVGISYDNGKGFRLKNIIDPTVIAGIVRTIYETVSMFNLIYVIPNSSDERIILYNLWVISGLKYRQRFHLTTPENSQKQNEEADTIKKLTEEIQNTALYQSKTENIQSTINRMIKEKDYKILFENGKAKALSWQDISVHMGLYKGVSDSMYTYYSFYSHPSNVSVFQFRDLFASTDSFIRMSLFNAENAIKLISHFIASFVIYSPKALIYFESLPLLHQMVVNVHAGLIRKKRNPINDVLTYLH
jgi:hypothetical protein